MQRYTDVLAALNIAMNLMIDEGDTLLVAAITHPLDLAEKALMLRRSDMLSRTSVGPRPHLRPDEDGFRDSHT